QEKPDQAFKAYGRLIELYGDRAEIELAELVALALLGKVGILFQQDKQMAARESLNQALAHAIRFLDEAHEVTKHIHDVLKKASV
ncbi:MAG: hypothetical protein AB8B77_03340, partial [Alphaproteobacteria bacterium]